MMRLLGHKPQLHCHKDTTRGRKDPNGASLKLDLIFRSIVLNLGLSTISAYQLLRSWFESEVGSLHPNWCIQENFTFLWLQAR
ncbi:hypothetical protein Peur_027504 [Populus x canadensis]